MENLKVTSIESLKSKGVDKGAILPLEGFYDDEPFVVRVKRVPLLGMVEAGFIPNELLTAAHNVFYGNKGAKLTPEEIGNNFKEYAEICKVIAKNSLVEPTYAELQEAGIELTDNQLVGIYSFWQSGVAALKSFRNIFGNTKNTENK